MCLATIFMGVRQESAIVAKDVSVIRRRDARTIEAQTLFGESMRFEGVTINEVDLTGNYVILVKEEMSNA